MFAQTGVSVPRRSSARPLAKRLLTESAQNPCGNVLRSCFMFIPIQVASPSACGGASWLGVTEYRLTLGMKFLWVRQSFHFRHGVDPFDRYPVDQPFVAHRRARHRKT